VSHNSASRAGEPFEMMVAGKSMLPNPVMRFCTEELKIRTVRRWVDAELGWATWLNQVGLRFDELHRVQRMAKRNAAHKERFYARAPLARARIVKSDVMAFWASQPFDLRLKGAWEGNCDGCFLKRIASIKRMARDYPERIDWWIKQEQEATHKGTLTPDAAYFRKDRPSFARLVAAEWDQGRFDLDPQDDGMDLFAACDGCGV
jgi:hypothetical protein